MEINVCEQEWWLYSSVHNKWISTPQTFSSTLFVQTVNLLSRRCFSTTLTFTHTHTTNKKYLIKQVSDMKKRREPHTLHNTTHILDIIGDGC